MKLIETNIDDCKIIEHNIFNDERGSFNKYYDFGIFNNLIDGFVVKQINHSINLKKGTFRGFHYQNNPENEAKIIKCIKGSILDFAVDLRKASKTYLQYVSVELKSNINNMLLVPKGFAHGFLTLEDNSEVLYLHNGNYSPEFDAGINYADKNINLSLPFDISVVSEKDRKLPFVNNEFKGL